MRRPTAGDHSREPTRTAERRAGRRILIRSGLVAVVLVAAYYTLPLDRAFTAGTVLALIAGLAVSGVAFIWQVQAIMQSPNPRVTAIAALVSTIPLFLLLFATCYYLIEHGSPGSFTQPMSRTDALYFTVTVFSTVGFGDIAPQSETARGLAIGQMVLDLFLIGIAARLLMHNLQEGMRRKHADPENPGTVPGDEDDG